MVRSRREFLKTSSALAAVGLTTSVAGCSDLPVVGDDGGSGPGGTGGGDFANWFYPPDAIRDALTTATGQKRDNLVAMGRRGRALVESTYTWRAVGRKMTRAYEWLSSREAKPDCIREMV